jgi:peptidoglycan/LPS O-acetylase OafA/YrhL
MKGGRLEILAGTITTMEGAADAKKTSVQRAADAKGSRYYRPELDALRFFAFVCVFVLHTGEYIQFNHHWLGVWTAAGKYGVCLFFLLSAFLITELLFRERERTGRVHIPSFYMRRILRIWPLYFAAFYGLALLNHFVPGVGSDDKHAWIAFTFLYGNWYIARHGWVVGAAGPLWSISVEEQFYLLIPLLAAKGGRRAVQVASWILLALAYGVVSYFVAHPNLKAEAEWTNTFVQFQFFCAGTLLAIHLRGRTLPLPFPARLAGFGAGLFLWQKTFSMHDSIALWICVLLGTVLLFVCTLGIPSRLVPSWLSYFGRISYGLYVFHTLVLFLVFTGLGHLPLAVRLRGAAGVRISLLIEVAASFGLDLLFAHLSFVYFEGYFLRLKSRFTFVASGG